LVCHLTLFRTKTTFLPVFFRHLLRLTNQWLMISLWLRLKRRWLTWLQKRDNWTRIWYVKYPDLGKYRVLHIRVRNVVFGRNNTWKHYQRHIN
jgi:hypothetical protein